MAFKKVKLYKAPGPESIPGHVLRARVTSWQRWLPISSTSPFRASTTIPIAKKQVVCLNDYCPVALTSVITKPADSQTTHPVYLPYTLVQLAYRRNRATDVAIALATHTLPCPPGKREHICVKALSWLQLSIQHDSESWKTHFLLAHHKHGTVQMIWPSRAMMTQSTEWTWRDQTTGARTTTSLNISETKEATVDYRKQQKRVDLGGCQPNLIGLVT